MEDEISCPLSPAGALRGLRELADQGFLGPASCLLEAPHSQQRGEGGRVGGGGKHRRPGAKELGHQQCLPHGVFATLEAIMFSVCIVCGEIFF